MNELAHHESNTWNKAISIFQQAVNEDCKWFLKCQAEISQQPCMQYVRWLYDSRLKLAISCALPMVKLISRQTQGMAEDSRCANSEMSYGFCPLGLGCTLQYIVFLWMYVFRLGLCYSYVLSNIGIFYSYVISSFGKRLYGMEEDRCASPKRPGRSCGAKSRFSIPPPLGLAENYAMVGVHRYRNDGDRLGDGGVWRYRGNRERGSYIEYTFRPASAR